MNSSSQIAQNAPAQPSQRWVAVGAPPPRVPRLSARVVFFPIVFFEAYLTLTVLLFAFGPWNWPVSNPVILYGFLALAQIALFAGYRTATHRKPRLLPANWRLRKQLLHLSLLIGFVWLPQLYKTRTNQLSFDLADAARAVLAGLSDPAKQYHLRINGVSLVLQVHTTLMGYVGFFAYPFIWLLFPLCVIYWSRLSRLLRIALVIWLTADLLTWAAAGTNKGIADFAILLPWLLVARKPDILMRVKLRKAAVIGLVALVGISAVGIFFGVNNLGRAGGQAVALYDKQSGSSVNTSHPLLILLPPVVQGATAALISYLTQGYYALGLSLNEPFVPCWGLGNSYFLEGLARKYVSVSILDRTYPARIGGSGWDRYRNWHSIYPWIASDVTFWGALAFMFAIGWLFATVWSDVVYNRDPTAIALFVLLLEMLYYTPANNQVLGFPGTATPFWFWLTVWLILRYRGQSRTGRSLPTPWATGLAGRPE